MQNVYRGMMLFMLTLLLVMTSACGQQPQSASPAENEEAPASGGSDTENAADTSGSADQAASDTTIIVGSKDFTEQFIIGEMYALALENAGLPVERKMNLGGTPVAHAALESGEIHLYPEYTGTGLLTVLKMPVNSDADEVFETVASAYKEQFNIMWLTPSPMNNTQALAMTGEDAEQYGIATFSDMVANAGDLIMIGPPEFQEREDGLPGLKEVYGDFDLKEYIAVDPGLRYQGLVEGRADVAVAFGTDGEISAFDLVVLEDDKKMFPPYQIAPVVRQEIIDAHPAVATVLNELSATITNDVMRRLNYEVSGNQREPADVAQEFLVEEGLIAE